MSALAVLFKYNGGLHIPVTIIATIVEVIGLGIWFYLHQRGVSEYALTGSLDGILFIYLGAGLLFVFLLIEHIVSQFAHNITEAKKTATKQESVSLKQFKGIIGFTLFEVFVWVVWLLLINFGQVIFGEDVTGKIVAFGVAIVFFFAGLYFEHQFTNNVKNDLRFFNFGNRHLAAPSRRLVFVGLLVFTAFEVGGGAGWVTIQNLVNPDDQNTQIVVNQDVSFFALFGIGLIAMAIGSFIEHYIADNVGRIKK